jgi:DNA ligase (NAD+)
MNQTIDMFAEPTADKLASSLANYNAAYRAGKPEISDDRYDALIEQLRALSPSHPYLHYVEPEPEDLFAKSAKVRHKKMMLSTEKAYTQEEIVKFVRRIEEHADTIGIDPKSVVYRATGKLDGMAGNDIDNVLATRGDGAQGYDVTRNFDRGLVAVGGRNQGLGEIVVHLPYYNTFLSDHFEHARNFVTGAIGADTLNEEAEQAFTEGAVRFVPYGQIFSMDVSGEELSANIAAIESEVKANTEYLLDGIVIDVLNEKIRETIGSTSHHNKYQIAKKVKGEFGTTTVTDIRWQTGRTGVVTPVIACESIYLSGCNITSITAHNAGTVIRKGLGVGAVIEIVRAGEVVPKHERTIEAADIPTTPSHCPSCGSELVWEKDLEGEDTYLRCLNVGGCEAQIANGLLHFFNIMGNIDEFGPATVDTLVKNGITTLEQIYALKEQDFMNMGFGPKESANRVTELGRSCTEQIEDWRFLAAQGIHHLGRGDSRKLLRHFPLKELEAITVEQIISIKGFGDITSPAIAYGLARRMPTIKHLLGLGFNLSSTPMAGEVISDSPIAGKGIVFTGSMLRASRSEMEAQARSMGANVQSSVSGKTDYLVAGMNVGAGKTAKAEKHGTTVLTEEEYLNFIS